jgi:hypothetical protein
MGMYNEIYDECRKCSHSGSMQISQIVLGFGDFRIYDLADLKARYDDGTLNASQLDRLAAELADESNVFRCNNDACNHTWRADPARILAIQMLPHVSKQMRVSRALQMLRDAGILI